MKYSPEQTQRYFEAFEPWGSADMLIFTLVIGALIIGLLMEWSLKQN